MTFITALPIAGTDIDLVSERDLESAPDVTSQALADQASGGAGSREFLEGVTEEQPRRLAIRAFALPDRNAVRSEDHGFTIAGAGSPVRPPSTRCLRTSDCNRILRRRPQVGSVPQAKSAADRNGRWHQSDDHSMPVTPDAEAVMDHTPHIPSHSLPKRSS